MNAGPEVIDARHLGTPHVIAVFRQDDVLVDPGPGVCAETVVAALGGRVPFAILLTHIHLDHAGATGALVRRWPGVEVWVHERGAPHIVDPSRLVASATRLYGDDMPRLWGEIVPVPEANVRVLRGGETIGPWRVAYTPGHAQHHVAYLHEPSGTAFAGDVAGVRIEDGPVLAPTPPPDIDLEAWQASIDTVAGWRPARLAVTHFGLYDDVGPHLAELSESLEWAGELARAGDPAAFEARMREHIAQSAGAAAAPAYFQGMPPEQLYPGLARYWSRREAS